MAAKTQLDYVWRGEIKARDREALMNAFRDLFTTMVDGAVLLTADEPELTGFVIRAELENVSGKWD